MIENLTDEHRHCGQYYWIKTKAGWIPGPWKATERHLSVCRGLDFCEIMNARDKIEADSLRVFDYPWREDARWYDRFKGFSFNASDDNIIRFSNTGRAYRLKKTLRWFNRIVASEFEYIPLISSPGPFNIRPSAFLTLQDVAQLTSFSLIPADAPSLDELIALANKYKIDRLDYETLGLQEPGRAFAQCLLFLSGIRKSKTMNKCHTTYGFKHAVESPDKYLNTPHTSHAWEGYYTAESIFVLAAVHAGFTVERNRPAITYLINIDERSFLERCRFLAFHARLPTPE